MTTPIAVAKGYSPESRVSVKVLYDFEYISPEGKDIAIKRGEKLTLLEKTDTEWWKVRRFKAPFYVPANYVTETETFDVTKDTMGQWELAMRSNDIKEWASGGLRGLTWQLKSSPSWLGNGDPDNANRRRPEGNGSFPRIRASFTSAPQGHADGAAGRRSPTGKRSWRKSTGRSRVDKAEKKSPLMANVVTGNRSPSPLAFGGTADCTEPFMTHDYEGAPAKLQELYCGTRGAFPRRTASKDPSYEHLGKFKVIDDDTKDQADARLHVNEVAAVPVQSDDSISSEGSARFLPLPLQAGTGGSHFASQSSGNLQTKSQRQMQSSIPGWTATVEGHGQTSYVHGATGERWLSAEDDLGQTYFYRENTNHVAWELPEYSPPRPPPPLRSISMPGAEPQHSSPLTLLAKASREQKSLLTLIGASQRAHHARPHSAPDSGSLSPDAVDLPPSTSNSAPTPTVQHTNTASNAAGIEVGSLSGILKQDALLTCRLTESNRKNGKKIWEQSFVIATATQLVIYKEEKSPKKGHGTEELSFESTMPDAVLSLHDAKGLWTSLKTSKKNVLEISCENGSYLLQHDDPLLMKEWSVLLSGRPVNNSQHSPVGLKDRTTTADSPEELRPDDQSKDGIWRAKGSRFKRGGTYSVIGVTSQVASVREKLKGLLARRPTMKDLEAKGIIRENIFNTHLLFLCNREQTTVPKFVERCIAAIEAKGLEAEGLYRVTPSSAEVQALRSQIDEDDMYTLSNWDVHVLAGALKLFFRELQEPLIPFDYYVPLMEAMRMTDTSQQLSRFKLLISMMMPATRETLHILMAHLLRVSAQCDKNKMTVENIAKVFGQTLMRPERDISAASQLTNAHYHNAVIEYILSNYVKIF